MKCPKCGYTSFESNDTCKKCSHDLIAHRETYGLKPVVFQMDRRATMAAAIVAEAAPAAVPQQPAEQAADMFSFDIPDQKPVTAVEEPPVSTPFSFDERPAPSPAEPASPFSFSFDDDQTTTKNATPEDAFADLLETTQLSEPAPAATPAMASTPPLAGDAPGEYDLSSFSWDDTPVESSGGEPKKKADDDFTSLFGEIDDAAMKK